MHMCVCVCVCVYIYIYIYIHTYAYLNYDVISSLISGALAALRIVHCNHSISFKNMKDIRKRRTDFHEI